MKSMLRVATLFATLITFARPCTAAIALDTSAELGVSAANVTSFSGNYTCTGSNLLLIAYATAFNGDDLTSMTYNGVSMTFLDKHGLSGTSQEVYAYGLLGPATGTNTLQLNGNSDQYGLAAISYTGVAQSGLPDAFTDGGATATADFSLTLTPVAANCWIVFMVVSDQSQPSAGTGSTLRTQNNTSGLGGFDTNGTVAGATTMHATSLTAGGWGGIILSFAPATSSTAPHGLTLRGVGGR